MSTHAANSLISDLAEMVKAVEELPQVQQELDVAHDEIAALKGDLHGQAEHIATLETQIATLQASLKTAEANRDDAELRFLEIEDRFSKLASAVTGAHSLVAVANAVAEPQGEVTQAKADPTAGAATPITESPSVTSLNADNSASAQSTEGESAIPPTVSSQSSEAGSVIPFAGESAANPTPAVTAPIPTSTSASPPVIASTSGPIGTMTSTPASEGVSVPMDPTPASASEVASYSSVANELTTASTQSDNGGVQPSPLQSSSVPIPSTTPGVAASANGSANPSTDAGGEQARPYEGKAYSEVVSQTYGDTISTGTYISLSTWLKGGGTEANYYR